MASVFLYVTTSGEAEAARIARILVDERLCACANVISGMRSFYRWQGEVQDDREAVLILKTRDSLADSATERIKALHGYDLPCVVVLPLVGGNPDFLSWIEKETAAAVPPRP